MIFVKFKRQFTPDMTDLITGLPQVTEWMDVSVNPREVCLNGGFIYRVKNPLKSNGIYGFTEGVGEGVAGKILTCGMPIMPYVPPYSGNWKPTATTYGTKTTFTKIEKKFDTTIPGHIMPGAPGVLCQIRLVVTRNCYKCFMEIHPEDTHIKMNCPLDLKIRREQKETVFKDNGVSYVVCCKNCM